MYKVIFHSLSPVETTVKAEFDLFSPAINQYMALCQKAMREMFLEYGVSYHVTVRLIDRDGSEMKYCELKQSSY